MTGGVTFMDMLTLVLFVVGLVLLVGGAEALVRGASGLAAAAGISPSGGDAPDGSYIADLADYIDKGQTASPLLDLSSKK